MSEKDSTSPATTGVAYDAMAPVWTKIQTVLDGTESMRDAGQMYLPRHENEGDLAYQERLARCTLLNITKLTLNSWVGRPFGETIKWEGVPAEIEGYFANIDLVGNDIHVFFRDWFADGVAKAYSHVLVDFPRAAPKADGTVRTLADDEREGVRPYWVHIRPEKLIFADAAMIDGREVLREIRIREYVTERNGMAETQVEQIRRIFVNPEPDSGCIVELWRVKDTSKEKQEWYVWDTYEMSIQVIPLVTFYADRDSFMMGTAPLEDLADLNIAHWQSTSDQRAILTVARFPILALSGGVDEKEKLKIGPFQWLWSPDKDGKFYYVEHTGAAIGAGAKDLADLENQMSEYGAQFLKKKPGNQTATARALDTAESTSALQDMVKRFGFAVNQALDLTARWKKIEDGGTATMSTDFSHDAVDQATLNTLRETRKQRDISREAYLKQLIAWEVLPEDFDPKADLVLLENEQMDLFGTNEPIDDAIIEEEEGNEE